MKFDLKYNQLPVFTLLCGGVGALLRLWLYSTGLDEEGMLIASHPAGILVLILSSLVVIALMWFLRHFSSQGKYPQQFPVSIAGAVGAFVGAVCLLVAAMQELALRQSVLAFLSGILGVAAAISLAFTGLCRLKALRPSFLFHTLVCLYCVLRLFSRYQTWSADPQLHDYCFQLLATVAAMLFAYHRAALDLTCDSRRPLVIVGLLGTYFCCLSLVASNGPLFYGGLAAWMVTNLGELTTPVQAATEEG